MPKRRVWSLWELMNRFELRPLMDSLQGMSMMLIGFAARRSGTELAQTERAMAVDSAKRLQTILSFGEFPDSCGKIDKSIEWMSSGLTDSSAMGTEIRNITEFVMMEADKKKFLYVSPDRTQYLDKPDLLGEVVSDSFPSASSDIREAGNCLAAECNTAAVFHLMRSVEWGLRALCSDLGFKNVKAKIKKSGHVTYTPIEYTEWEKLLDGVQDRVDAKIRGLKRSSEKQKLQEFYYPALQDIRGIRDAWRNHVMHSRAEYSREDAGAIFGHVKRLMQSLSARISEV